MKENLWIGLGLSALAGLATTAGSLLGIIIAKPGPVFMSFTLGFSAGVMILVSFVELLAGSIESVGFFQAHVAFLAGMAAFFLIDLLVPHDYIAEKHVSKGGRSGPMMRTGMLIALGIGIHNFPEGMAALAGSLKNIKLGISIAIAIAIHNIPEGLAVSAPVLAATGSRKKAFWWSFLSGVSEPVGAMISAMFLMPFLTDKLLGWLLAGIGGIMTAISLDEIIPSAKAYNSGHVTIFGIMSGMAVMFISLWMLR